jgi:hypothetical protein
LSLEEKIFLIGFFLSFLFIFNFSLLCFFSLVLSLKKFLWVEISKIFGGLDGLGGLLQNLALVGWVSFSSLHASILLLCSSSFLLLLRLRRSCGRFSF